PRSSSVTVSSPSSARSGGSRTSSPQNGNDMIPGAHPGQAPSEHQHLMNTSTSERQSHRSTHRRHTRGLTPTSKESPMGSVRVAIVGVGNCATSLIQGVEYYKDADPAGTVPGLMHVKFGDYHVSDVEFVAAFDVDAKKVDFDLSEAIHNSENNTIKIADV